MEHQELEHTVDELFERSDSLVHEIMGRIALLVTLSQSLADSTNVEGGG